MGPSEFLRLLSRSCRRSGGARGLAESHCQIPDALHMCRRAAVLSGLTVGAADPEQQGCRSERRSPHRRLARSNKGGLHRGALTGHVQQLASGKEKTIPLLLTLKLVTDRCSYLDYCSVEVKS